MSNEELGSDHLILPITLPSANLPVHTYALADSGGSAIAFMDERFAKLHKFPFTALKRSLVLNVVDGRSIASGHITHYVEAPMRISHHVETIPFLITTLGHYPVVLGIKWLQRHDATTKWAANMVLLNSPYCRKNCLEAGKIAIVPGIVEVPDVPDHLRINKEPEHLLNMQKIEDVKPAPTPPERTPLRTHQERRIEAKQKPPEVIGEVPKDKGIIPSKFQDESKPEKSLNICMIGAAAYAMYSRKKDHQLLAISLRDIDKALNERKRPDPATLLPKEYHDYLDVFSRTESDKLPPHRPYDYDIPLKPGTEPPAEALRKHSQDELRVIQKYLTEHMSKGWIRASRSPAAAPVLLVKKPGGGIRFCVDYRGLNDITVKNRYPLPLIRETLDRLSQAKYYTKLDIIAAFNRMRIKEGEEWKTAFRTRYGLFEYLVMPFGLHGAPATFQHFINDVLREHLDIFVSAYIDDLLIYSKTLEEHKQHVRQVLEKLRTAGLQVDIEKCDFHVEEVLYLGMIVGKHGIKMDPAKVAAVKEWVRPENVKDVQSFLGFANFYRRFIAGFSEVARPLTALTGNIPWEWTEACQDAFENLKTLICTAPILALYDPDKECIVETDASDHVSAGVLSQPDTQGLLRPVAFFSKKHSPAECNYEIYDKELLAVILAFQEWRAELEGSPHQIKVLSDHKNLEYFMTTKQLNRRQARWAEYLSRFNFKIHYRPGKLGTKPDALTRRSGDLPKEGDPRLAFQNQVLLKPHQLAVTTRAQAAAATENNNQPGCQPNHQFDHQVNEVEGSENVAVRIANPGRSSEMPEASQLLNPVRNIDVDDQHDEDELPLTEAIDQAYEKDEFADEILKALRTGIRFSKKITLGLCREQGGKLYYQERLYVPDNE